jgi:hypothetical protein
MTGDLAEEREAMQLAKAEAKAKENAMYSAFAEKKRKEAEVKQASKQDAHNA